MFKGSIISRSGDGMKEYAKKWLKDAEAAGFFNQVDDDKQLVLERKISKQQRKLQNATDNAITLHTEFFEGNALGEGI